MSAANDTSALRTWIVEASKNGAVLATFRADAVDSTDVVTEAIDRFNHIPLVKVQVWPLVERFAFEGRMAFRAGRKLHLGASDEAVAGYEEAQRAAALAATVRRSTFHLISGAA